ncbi:Tubulin-specific chaperone B [Sarcoptes scabiei]|uniref:Tubulin-specific chaperone B n=1 Tax=Sarcoptes scabiei TaxID=52283 RepID=A0A131ZXW8_SARSC|nr:Tubulin-specific chaperone B [Sarcoptes scabiei]KPM03698.1 tubulin-specific chaperone B-like protein [Sarcoptes scabiei]
MPIEEFSQIVCEITVNKNDNIIERKFPPEIHFDVLRNRLELITGASASSMTLTFQDSSGNNLDLDESVKCLMDLIKPGAENRLRLFVEDPDAIKFDNLSTVPKYEMNDEKYSERTDSVRVFKNKLRQSKLAQFDTDRFKIGSRCEVTIKNSESKRGQIMYIGSIGSLPGTFIGVYYDKPCGKNDGSFENIRYFECPQNHGSFVRPDSVHVGDYPPITETNSEPQ